MGTFLTYQKIPFRPSNYYNAITLNIHLTQFLVTYFSNERELLTRGFGRLNILEDFQKNILSDKDWNRVLFSVLP